MPPKIQKYKMCLINLEIGLKSKKKRVQTCLLLKNSILGQILTPKMAPKCPKNEKFEKWLWNSEIGLKIVANRVLTLLSLDNSKFSPILAYQGIPKNTFGAITQGPDFSQTCSFLQKLYLELNHEYFHYIEEIMHIVGLDFL